MVYDKFSDNTEIMKDLDEQIHQITTNCTGLTYCFKNLKQSSSFLCQSFLQNPNIQKNFLQDTILKIKPSELDFEKVSSDVYELDTLCLELLQSLKCITLLDSDCSFYYEIKAELLLDFLKDTMIQLSTEKQYESQLSFVFDTLCGNLETLEIVLHILISDKDSEIASEIQDFAMNWILLKLLDEKNGSLAHFLWKQPFLKLRNIAAKFSAFSSYYIDHLIQCASSLSLEYENFTKCWKKRVSMTEVTLEYQEILEHFKILLCIEDDLCKTVKTHLSSLLTSEAKSSIWHDICSHVLS
ncbi:uncharacterized protein LOC129962696 isoform X2 [Argiope bruennichi]|uniref:uncharacterized protein LOC129962696 isoform X2 n=1 Tax=Argiope bruennichi TaxID=94029 RepID=UPI002493F4E0|nr:uncharacterized protein LOC129962696 isoform X2 [Argiope bruennichi]